MNQKSLFYIPLLKKKTVWSLNHTSRRYPEIKQLRGSFNALLVVSMDF